MCSSDLQIQALAYGLVADTPSIVSVFAGRIADTGDDPIPYIASALIEARCCQNVEVLWASPREALNVYQSEECGCAIITATDDIISKLKMHGKSLEEFSLDTVKMFYADATKAGFQL